MMARVRLDRWRNVAILALLIAGVATQCAAATPQRNANLDAIMAKMHCGFGDEGGDADVACDDDRGMFLCEILRAQNKVAGCSIDPVKTRVPDLDKVQDVDFVKDGKMDKVAVASPCIVWAYSEGYVAPNRSRWQHACAAQLLDSLACATPSSNSAATICQAATKPVCMVLNRAQLVTECK